MKTQALTKINEHMPALFEDFFKPWNEWFVDGKLFGREMNVPAVNITKNKDDYLVSLAAPGLKKDDFKISIEGDLLTISSEKEETREEKDEKYARKEYNYSSFSRCFTLPGEVNTENIDAKYDDGVLKITLPRNEAAKSASATQIAIH